MHRLGYISFALGYCKIIIFNQVPLSITKHLNSPKCKRQDHAKVWKCNKLVYNSKKRERKK